MSTSAGLSTPSPPTIPPDVTRSTPPVINRTLGLANAGYQSSVTMSRLQPTWSVGVTASCRAGSLIDLRICRLPTALNGASIHCRRVIAIAPISMIVSMDFRSSRCSQGNRRNSRFARSEYAKSILGIVHPGDRW
jgi:hypothetical protein